MFTSMGTSVRPQQFIPHVDTNFNDSMRPLVVWNGFLRSYQRTASRTASNQFLMIYFSLENHVIADRSRMQILPNQMSKKMRWFRTAYLNQRLYTWIFWLSMLGFTLFYNLTTFRWLGVGSIVNNFQKEYSESKRAAREADAIENCAEYIPGNSLCIISRNTLWFLALVAGYQKLQAPSNLDAWTNYEPKNEWKKIE